MPKPPVSRTQIYDAQFQEVLHYERTNDPIQLSEYYQGNRGLRHRTPFSERGRETTNTEHIDITGEEETIFDASGGQSTERTPLLSQPDAVPPGGAIPGIGGVIPGVNAAGVAAGVGAGAGAASFGAFIAWLFGRGGGRGGDSDTFVYDGHHFLGPGNKVDFRPPVNEPDAIAKEHDIAYGNSKTKEDVKKADIEAIRKFLKTGEVSGVVGAWGLRAKTFFEKIFGVKYPSLPGKICLLLKDYRNHLIRIHHLKQTGLI